MSILDDKDLINQLLKHGSDFEYKFTSHGQAAAATIDANAALKQLLDNLESQLYPPERDPNAPAIATQSDGPVNLTSTNLEGLGALVSFLAQNKITLDGQRIAFFQKEDPKSEDYQLYRLEPNAGFLERADRTKVTDGFFVNTDLLVKYIRTLQASQAKKPNDVLRVQIGALIDQANKLLGTKISETYQEPEKTLSDNQVLDSFPQQIDPKNYTANGNAALTFGDIKTPEALNSWMQSHSITVNGKTMADQDFNPCVVVQTMYNKARWLLARATNTTLKERYTIYVKQVEKIGPSITGPDGKACALQGAPTAGTGAGATGQGTAEAFNQLIESMPLRVSDIDFQRIKTFFDKFRQVVNPQRPGVASAFNAMNAVEQTYMPAATRNTATQMETFPLNVDVTTLGTWLSGNKGQREGLALVANLRYIISLTASVIQILKNSYQIQDQGQLSAIEGQVGGGAASAGIAGSNLNHLALWERALMAQSGPTNTPQSRGY